MIRSLDGGETWTESRILISEPDQISMGGFVVHGMVVLPSIRRYRDAAERFLALYRMDAVGRWQVGCVRRSLFSAGFETGDATRWD